MDRMSVAHRSYTMSRIRSRGNESTERALVRLMRQEGIRGWRRHTPLPGQPDFVFPKRRLVVFVDGCYWHGCPRCGLSSKSNKAYWGPKIQGNRGRDRANTRKLKGLGWSVIRLWEHQIAASPGRCMRRLRRALDASTPITDR